MTTFQWLHNGSPLKPSSRTELKQGFGISTVVMKGFKASDEGMYQCFASEQNETTQGISEIVLGGIFPRITERFRGSTLHPHLPVLLVCRATGRPLPTISWSLDDEPIILSERIVMGQYVEEEEVVSFVNITGITVEDGGTYLCKTENRVGKEVHFASINVFGPPYIRPMQRKTGIASKSLVIKCPASGYPIFNFTWSKGSQQLPFNRHQTVFPNGTLLIKELQASSDGGSYSCSVRGTSGEVVSRSVDVDVLVPPRIVPFLFREEVVEGLRVQVTCSVDIGDLPITFMWKKDDQPLKEIEIRQIDEYSSMIVIDRATSSHSGNYSCCVENGAAKDFYSAILKVSVPPSWTTEPKQEVKFLDGMISQLHCAASGFPEPLIKWKKMLEYSNEFEEIPAIEPSGLQVTSNGTLTFSPTRKIHAGSYLCEASNGLGAGLSKIVKLEINAPATVTVSSEVVQVPLGRSATLTCSVSGDSPLEINWKTENFIIHYTGQRIVINNRVRQDGSVVSDLTVNLAVKDDTKIYTCFGRNIFGRDEKGIQLLVQEPPSPPQYVQVDELSSRSLKLSWTPPEDGNSPLKQYILQFKRANVPWGPQPEQIILSNAELTSWLLDLNPGTTYSFRLIASNELGDSIPSEELEIKTMPEPPSKVPINIALISESSNSLKVTWESPAKEYWYSDSLNYSLIIKDSGSFNTSIINYEGGDSTGPFEAVIYGLRAYTKYYVVVNAVNDAGNGPNSTIISSKTLPDVPESAPSNLKCLSVSPTSIKVTWTGASLSTLRGQLTFYKVTIEESEPILYEPVTEERTFSSNYGTITNLLSYTCYSIRVSSSTQAGSGPLSDPVMCRTLEDVPDPVSGFNVLASSPRTIMASWLPSQKANGKITGYNFYVRAVSPGSWNLKAVVPTAEPTSDPEVLRWKVNPMNCHFTIGGLISGGKFQAWISPENKAGEGPGVRTVAISLSPPNSPKIVTIGRKVLASYRSTVLLDCVAISRANLQRKWLKFSQEIKNFDRYILNSNGSLLIIDARKQDRGNYTCSVQSKANEDSIVHSVDVLMPPDSPVISIMKINESSIILGFRLEDNGGAVPKDFLANFKQVGAEWKEICIHWSERTVTFIGLKCGTTYLARLAARNVVGVGMSSEILRISTLGGKPKLPVNSSFIQLNSTCIILAFKSFEDGGCPMQELNIFIRRAETSHWTAVGETSLGLEEKVIRGLDPDSSHELRITARNEAGITESLYNFRTLPLIKDYFEEIHVAVHTESTSISLADIRIILSISISCVAVLSAAVAGILLCLKRRQQAAQLSSITHSYGPSDSSFPVAYQEKNEFDFKERIQRQDDQFQRNFLASPEEEYSDISPYATFQLSDLPTNVTSMYGNSQTSNIMKLNCMEDTILPGYSTNPPTILERPTHLYEKMKHPPNVQSRDFSTISTYKLETFSQCDSQSGDDREYKIIQRKRRRYTKSDEGANLVLGKKIKPPVDFMDDAKLTDKNKGAQWKVCESHCTVEV
ncbi:cell adhesion molecule Dscam2-like isoform X2 [Artemia franciscana]|uniref:cell adhesion molecule Dscam2-like isoform X2 n=1 Tax=Artemia franciscana TaxID=6661 RepID=UPI0032DAEF0D